VPVDDPPRQRHHERLQGREQRSKRRLLTVEQRLDVLTLAFDNQAWCLRLRKGQSN
jgi:hypothetical protein